MQGYTVYEHPLNERIRTLLRLEHLFRQSRHFIEGKSAWDSRIFIATLIDILDIFSRGDMKTELLKELERATGNLRGLMDIPQVDHNKLGTILRAMEHLIDNLHGMNAQPGQSLREDDFLTAIRQRSTIPGGTCDFDLPAYHLWLAASYDKRLQDQRRWLNSLDPVHQAIELLLKMIRNSAEIRPIRCEQGSYQQQLDNHTPFQLVRVMLPNDSPYYAEISGSRHRFTIRFLKPAPQRPALADEAVEFRLASCSL